VGRRAGDFRGPQRHRRRDAGRHPYHPRGDRLATAHPAKFPEAVERATGIRPALPAHLADLYERPESCHTLPNDIGAVREHIRARAGKVAA
jgi:hypothetical protein